MGSPAGGKASVAASSGTRPAGTLLAPNRDAEGLARRIGIQADHPHEREKRASLLAGEFNRHSGCQGFAPEPKAPAPNPYCLPPPVLHRHPSKSAIQVAGVGPDAPHDDRRAPVLSFGVEFANFGRDRYLAPGAARRSAARLLHRCRRSCGRRCGGRLVRGAKRIDDGEDNQCDYRANDDPGESGGFQLRWYTGTSGSLIPSPPLCKPVRSYAPSATPRGSPTAEVLATVRHALAVDTGSGALLRASRSSVDESLGEPRRGDWESAATPNRLRSG